MGLLKGQIAEAIVEVLSKAGRSLMLSSITTRVNKLLDTRYMPHDVRRCLEDKIAARVRQTPNSTWFLANTTAERVTTQAATTPPLTLKPWQTDALIHWERNACQGIIAAVTGAGKTYAAMGALASLRARHSRLSALVVVPQIDIMDQWCDKLSRAFPGQSIGRIGGDHHDDFSGVDGRSDTPLALVAVINSVRKAEVLERLFAHTKSGGWKKFVIADECHRYNRYTRQNKRLFDFGFDYRLGLSATVGQDHVVGLGNIVYEFDFADAGRAGIIPRFHLINVSVGLTDGEQSNYDDLSERMKSQWSIVTTVHPQLDWIWRTQPNMIMKQIRLIMGSVGEGKAPELEAYMRMAFLRASVFYGASRKMALGVELVRLLVKRWRIKTIVFFMRNRVADAVREDLSQQTGSDFFSRLQSGERIDCEVFNSQVPRKTRQRMLEHFRKAGAAALLACQCLDEGIDVPDVDAVVLVASTQGKRQRIQRIGRALRIGSSGRQPLVVTLFAAGTKDEKVVAEDHEIFGEVATIHELQEGECLPLIEKLLKNGN